MSLKYAQMGSVYLSSSGVIIGATSISLTSFSDIYGNVLTMTDFGSKGYGTLEPDTSNEEAFTFTGITPNANGTYTLTGVSTCLAKSPYTETSGLVRSHAGGTKMVVSDTVAFWNTFPNKNNDETILGTWTFNVSPSSLSATRASTSTLGNVKLTSAPLTTLGTVTMTIASPAVVTFNSHGLIAGDSVQFTTTGALPTGLSASTDYYVIAAGLTANAFELSLTVGGAAINTSGSQSGTHTLYRTTPFAVGNDDIRLPQNSYAVDAVGTDSYAITLSPAPTAYKAGQIFTFRAGTANTTAATLNVNGLGAITIKKNFNSDLATGDILAGQIVSVVYDSVTATFQLASPLAPSKSAVTTFAGNSGTFTKDPSGATTSTVIAHGLGVAPSKIRMKGVGINSSITWLSDGVWYSNGTYATYNLQMAEGGSTSTPDSLDTSTSYIIKVCVDATGPFSIFQTGTITVDATNITIAWSKTGSPSSISYNIFWEAEGYTTANVNA